MNQPINAMTRSSATQLTKPARVLSLDLGTRTGWAIHTANRPINQITNPVASGTERFKWCRTEADGVRFQRFAIWLKKMLSPTNKISVVYFERVYAHDGTFAAQIYGGFMAVLMVLCEVHRIPYIGVAVGTIKKFIAGKGDATKAEVIRSIKMRGHAPCDDNEADALALLYLAMEHINESSRETTNL